MLHLIVQIYRLSRTTLKTKALSCESQSRSRSRSFTVKSEQTFLLESTRKEGMTRILVLFVAQCTMVKCNAFWLKVMNSRIRTPKFLYILLKSWLCCCSLATLAPQQSGAHHYEPSTTPYSCHGVFTDQSIFSLYFSCANSKMTVSLDYTFAFSC